MRATVMTCEICLRLYVRSWSDGGNVGPFVGLAIDHLQHARRCATWPHDGILRDVYAGIRRPRRRLWTSTRSTARRVVLTYAERRGRYYRFARRSVQVMSSTTGDDLHVFDQFQLGSHQIFVASRVTVSARASRDDRRCAGGTTYFTASAEAYIPLHGRSRVIAASAARSSPMPVRSTVIRSHARPDETMSWATTPRCVSVGVGADLGVAVRSTACRLRDPGPEGRLRRDPGTVQVSASRRPF